ncbi:hypothetical protein [Catellatospora chokoriensis]|uniref:Uncharacterized protein n=1 Tax=Catellatospora chokoriensis TaxID=310353 RepID=A0A8J3NRS5_9ACTN|nr:hypothetical protein [Catellatospora chokoriensis]GIF89816.1 hypothetical protein Cch02nite_32600 [Catellatospora chokoriensis]
MNEPTGNPDKITSLWAQAEADRAELARLKTGVRRRMLLAVRLGVVDIERACSMLSAWGLPQLPRRWAVSCELLAVARCWQTGADRAIKHIRDIAPEQWQQAAGPDDSVHTVWPLEARFDPAAIADNDIRAYVVTARLGACVWVSAESRQAAVTQARARLVQIQHDLTEMTIDASVLERIEADEERTRPQPLRPPRDAPHRPPMPSLPPPLRLADAIRAQRRARRELAEFVRDIRARVIAALSDAEVHGRGHRDPHDLVDWFMVSSGLAGLPRSQQFAVTATVAMTIEATSAEQARSLSVQMLADSWPHYPQPGLPITFSDHRSVAEVAAGQGGFQVVWRVTYLVCQRAHRSAALAKEAVRLQLDTAALRAADVSLEVAELGLRPDRRLDPYQD